METVLMYHDVFNKSQDESGFNSPGANYYKIQVKIFETHLDLIHRSKPNTILTFDDGGVSFYSVIAPLLEKRGLLGHFFIATDYIGKNGFCNEAQIKELHERGHFIGSHSSSHPDNMDKLDIKKRKKEWLESIEKLSNIVGCRINEVSIPNGYYNSSDIRLLAEIGIKKVYTSSPTDKKSLDSTEIIGRQFVNCKTTDVVLNKMLSSFLYTKMILLRYKIIQFIKYIMGDSYIKVKKIIRNK